MRFASFRDHLDYDRLYDAIGFEPIRQDRDGNDVGHCFDLLGLHKHGDRTGKFIVYKDRGYVSCFVCGAMPLPEFIATLRQITRQDAVEWLFQFSGTREQDDDAFLEEIEHALAPRRRETPMLPIFNKAALDHHALYDEWPDEGLVWASNRGITRETAMRFDLRYGRISRMPPREVEDEPYFGNAIVLPHRWDGRLVGWQIRWLEDNRPKWLGKYVNTPDFPRDRTVYNFDSCCQIDLPITVVESCSTVLFLESNGYPAVATFGAKLTEAQMKLLRKFGQGVVLAPDNDLPGRRWLHMLSGYLDQYVPVYEAPVVPGEGSDLGSLAPDAAALHTYMERLAFL